MSGINQLQMKFDPKQDRILFRINTLDSTEFQLWLTRRYVRLLWQVMIRLLSTDEQIVSQQSELAKKEVLSFQQEEATQKMNFEQEYQSQATNHPLGNTPILLEKITVKNREDGTQLLCLLPESGQGVELAINQTLLHTICKLTQDAVGQANWDMDLNQSVNTDPTSAKPEPRAIN